MNNDVKQVIDRLDRIENWMSKINDAMVSMARTEEKMAQVIIQQAHHAAAIQKLEQENADIKSKMTRFEFAKVVVSRMFTAIAFICTIIYAAHPETAIELIKLLKGE